MRVQLVFIAILMGIFQTHAQTGVIKGRIFDANNNEPVAFANLIVFETQNGATADIDGNFSFNNLEPGFLKLKISAVGYAPEVTAEIIIRNNKTTYIDIPLEKISYDLETVTIKASPFKRQAESPVSLRSLGAGEIEKTPGANRDISKVIQALPGVSSSVSFRNDVIVRGGGPSENAFYLDGVEIPTLNHFSTQGASGGPVGIINADFIQEVDFYSGAFPASKGKALSSILDFTMKDGNPDKMNFKGTVGASDLAFTLDGPISKNTTLIASARRSYLQFLFELLELPFLPTYNDFQFKTKTKLNNKNEIILLGIGAIDQFDLNTDLDDPTDDQLYILNYLPVSEQWSYTVGAVFKHFREKGFDRYIISRNELNNTSYKYQNNDESSPDNLLYDLTSREIENKFRFEHTGRIDGFKYIYGAGYEYARYTNKYYNQLLFGNEIITIDTDNAITLSTWDFFGQISKGFFSDRLTLSLGLRTDASDYSAAMKNMFDQISPRFSASYGLSEQFFLNFNTGIYYQQPSYTTLGYRDENDILANKENNLSYIESSHVVGGVEWQPNDNAKITAEVFYKNYSNYPFSVNDSISLGSKSADYGIFGDEEVTSTGEGRAYGFELYSRLPSIRDYNFIVSYTYVHSEFKDIDGDYVASAWDNRHIMNITARKSFNNNWDIGLKWRYVGGAPYTPYDIEKSQQIQYWNLQNEAYLDYDSYNTLRLNDFHQLDIRVDKSYYFDKWMFSLYLDIQNIYNFTADEQDALTNLDENGNPMINAEDASIYDLRIIEQESGTILPTIGITIEF